MTLMLELDHNTHATLVSCYVPTMASTEQGKDEFYNQLRDAISGCHHRDKLILMGDFNARIGTDYQVWEGVLGRHGVSRMSSSGLHVLSICREFSLSIRNTFFKKRNCCKRT
uniref:Endonuclease/exonuclease/phosphatase domain-containing protein n=1 Tax=Octopus bimaculoides TaxID=37653 RepID=A0A0L8HZ15_OCTBM